MPSKGGFLSGIGKAADGAIGAGQDAVDGAIGAGQDAVRGGADFAGDVSPANPVSQAQSALSKVTIGAVALLAVLFVLLREYGRAKS